MQERLPKPKKECLSKANWGKSNELHFQKRSIGLIRSVVAITKHFRIGGKKAVRIDPFRCSKNTDIWILGCHHAPNPLRRLLPSYIRLMRRVLGSFHLRESKYGTTSHILVSTISIWWKVIERQPMHLSFGCSSLMGLSRRHWSREENRGKSWDGEGFC